MTFLVTALLVVLATNNDLGPAAAGPRASGGKTMPMGPPPSSSIASCTGTPAGFPSRLMTSGRNLVDANNCVVPKLRGFNMLVDAGFTWEQSHFGDIAALGGNINRAVVFWDTFEPSSGMISTSYRDALDLHIARAEAAGLYTVVSIHLNVGRTPSWTAVVDGVTTPPYYELERYYAHGQNITSYLANRYGNPASPHYTTAVVGMGVNEPGIGADSIRHGNESIPWLEGRQRQMITWMRVDGNAPDLIGFVALGYASQTPIYNAALGQNAGATNASPTAYDGVGGNVVYDLHTYFSATTNTSSPDDDGRQFNGQLYPTSQGGQSILVEDPARTYSSTATTRAQMYAYIKPYKDFLNDADIPLMLGEWGFPSGDTQASEEAWIADAMPTWSDAGTVIEMHWDYDVDSSNTTWSARPAGTTWRPSILSWLTP